jgi:hypothetical protein
LGCGQAKDSGFNLKANKWFMDENSLPNLSAVVDQCNEICLSILSDYFCVLTCFLLSPKLLFPVLIPSPKLIHSNLLATLLVSSSHFPDNSKFKANLNHFPLNRETQLKEASVYCYDANERAVFSHANSNKSD